MQFLPSPISEIESLYLVFKHLISIKEYVGRASADICFCFGLQWAYELGQASEVKVSVPLHGCEHFYLLTKPLQEPVSPDMPGITL